MSVQKPLYLRQNVQVEPLIDRWYAWPHLIPPATGARNLTERHLKIMESYINAPDIHANAVKNPKMLGGPFIDYGGKRRDEIRSLSTKIKAERTCLLELSAALTELDTMLRTRAKGYSLQPLYAEVPDCLKGYVELVYDLNSQPSYRLIEPLLYASKYYDPTQQGLTLSLIKEDDRPFVLSTPRLDSEDSVHFPVPFDAPVIDDLFRLKHAPQPWEKIEKLLEVPSDKGEVMQSFFTEEAPPRYVPYEGKGVRWRYFGHACILIESNGISMLFDPVLSYTYEGSVSRYTYLDLPDSIDYVLITHNHQDHVLLETLLQLRHKIKTVVVPRNSGGSLQDPSLKLILQHCGFDSIVELEEMGEIGTKEVRITGLPFFGEHADLDIRSKMAWLVRIGRHSMMFAADSCNIEPRLYEHLHGVLGDVDALFIGMECDGAPLSWLYGPLLSQRIERAMDESRRLSGSDYTQSMQIVKRFACKEVFIYAMGQEPWLNYLMNIKYTDESRPLIESNKLLAACREQGLLCERLFGEREILISE